MADGISPELILDIDEFGRSAHLTGIQAIASRVRNLLLMEKGENVKNYQMGVGLAQYLFEPLNDSTINTLRIEVSEQIREYLPDVQLEGVNVVQGSNKEVERSWNSLNITLNLKKIVEGTKQIIFTFQNSEDSKVKSDIFV